MSETKIAAQKRTEFGKGAARRLRRDSQVPAVIYGHGSEPLHIALPGHELMLALRQSNVLLTIDVEGEPQLALPKQIQRDPVKGFLEHVDLLLVRSGEKVSVDVAIHTVGDAAPDTLLVIEANTIPVMAEATHIPESFIVSIAGLRAGAQIHASDVILPEGVELDIEPDTLVINVTAATTAEALEAELAVAEAETGAEHDQPQSETGDDAEQDTSAES
ncbi:MAG TPA: 50S ribosomal protein L25/general stress protein Ctc [Actinopolymorphaceae bacterium]